MDENAPNMISEKVSGCILVVEDDPMVQRIVADMNECMGHRVLIANDGLEALEVLDQNSDIDILFSDVVMPGGMSGFELADAAVERHRNLKVLLTSGYPDAERQRSGESAARYRLIAKPYSMEEISGVYSEILG